MNHSLARLFAASAVIISVAGCSAQQQSPVAGAEPGSAAASASVPSSAMSAPSSPPTVEPAEPANASGLPAVDFCTEGERYLSKFPGLPSYRNPRLAPAGQGTIDCMYGTGPTNPTAPEAILVVVDLSVDPAKLAECNPETLPSHLVKVDSLERDYGWFAWTSPPTGPIKQAAICTGSHRFSVTIVNTPNATDEDTIDVLLASMV
jgi:hypothetical protein